jgi:hypothetical protein
LILNGKRENKRAFAGLVLRRRPYPQQECALHADGRARLPLRDILTKAWLIARAGARRFGGSARSYLAAAMRSVWSEEKAARVAIAAMKARVLRSIASLSNDLRDMERRLQDWYARQAAARPATVLPFPPRRSAAASAAVPAFRAA